MTVKQLIKKLSKLPEDTKVVIPNRSLFKDGYYAVNEVDDYTHIDGIVLIDTDYLTKIDDLIDSLERKA